MGIGRLFSFTTAIREDVAGDQSPVLNEGLGDCARQEQCSKRLRGDKGEREGGEPLLCDTFTAERSIGHKDGSVIVFLSRFRKQAC